MNHLILNICTLYNQNSIHLRNFNWLCKQQSEAAMILSFEFVCNVKIFAISFLVFYFLFLLVTVFTRIDKSCLCIFLLQWNLSKADTYGTEVFVRFREVSALERIELESSQI